MVTFHVLTFNISIIIIIITPPPSSCLLLLINIRMLLYLYCQVEAWGFLCGVGTGGISWMLHGGRRPLLFVGSVAALLHGAAVIMIVKGSRWNQRYKAMYSPLNGLFGPEEDDSSSSCFEDHQPSNNSLVTSLSPSTPGRYRRGCGGNRSEASQRWKLTLQWRRSERVDGILDEKQVHFEAIKKYYPHYIYDRAKSGSPVYYDFPGKGK